MDQSLNPIRITQAFRLALIGLVAGAVLVLLPRSSLALEAMPLPAKAGTRPWESEERGIGRSAMSLLDDTTIQAKPWIDSEYFMTQGQMAEIRQAYEASERAAEYRRNYGLFDKASAERQQAEIADLTHRVVDNARNKKFLEERDRAYKRLDLEKTAKKVPVLVGLIALTNSFYVGERGNALDWRLSPELRVWGWHNYDKSTGEFVVDTPIVSTTMTYQGKALEQRAANPASREELFEFGLAKVIPEIQVSTGVKYQLLNRSFTGNVSRPIAPNLVGSVSAGADASGTVPYEARLDYKISF